MMHLKEHDLLAPHTPPNLPEIKSNFRDPDDPPHWIGMEAWAAAVCFNTAEAARLGLPKRDLLVQFLGSRFRGRITMPDPSSSGTGYFHVSAWIQLFREEEAWRFMDRLHANIATYEHSGTNPAGTPRQASSRSGSP